MSVNINADTTNGLVLTSDTSGEIKLQSAGADIATVDSSGITMASGKGLAATGHVLQVVQSTYSTSTTFTTNTLTDLGLSASITPSSTSNKILVMVNITGLWKNASNTYYGAILQRDSTTIQEIVSGLYTNSATNRQDGSDSFMIYDSPSTTSSVTYNVQFRNEPGAGTITINGGNNGPSTMVLMEVAG
jgi:hypothetical protein